MNKLILPTKIVRFIAISLLFLFLIGCKENSSSTTLLIDNPTQLPMLIQIDETDYTIDSLSHLTIELPFGMHYMSFKQGKFHPKINQKKMPFFITPTNKKKLLINPSADTYVLTEQYYSKKDLVIEYDKPKVINGYEFYDDPSVLNALYISSPYDYSLDEEFPETIYLSSAKEEEIKRKIFRFNDYHRYYLTEWADFVSKNDESYTYYANVKFASFAEPIETRNDLSPFKDRPNLFPLVKELDDLIVKLPTYVKDVESFETATNQVYDKINEIKKHSDYQGKTDRDMLYNYLQLKVLGDKNSRVNLISNQLTFFEPIAISN